MTMPGLFVVGTDTGVGKTRLASAIARGLTEGGRRVGVLKPVATGSVGADDDTGALLAAVGGGIPRACVTPIAFEEPLAPPIAARRLGSPLDFARVECAVAGALAWWAERADVMIVEGVGGLLCPLAEGATVADLAIALDYPLVIVARRGLGTLNHTLLTVEAARLRALRVAGLVLNAAAPTAHPLAEATNADELVRRLDGIPLLAEIDHADDPETFSNAVRAVDWHSRAGTPRDSGLNSRDAESRRVRSTHPHH
jgi:dethiobiotin synthetase